MVENGQMYIFFYVKKMLKHLNLSQVTTLWIQENDINASWLFKRFGSLKILSDDKLIEGQP